MHNFPEGRQPIFWTISLENLMKMKKIQAVGASKILIYRSATGQIERERVSSMLLRIEVNTVVAMANYRYIRTQLE